MSPLLGRVLATMHHLALCVVLTDCLYILECLKSPMARAIQDQSFLITLKNMQLLGIHVCMHFMKTRLMLLIRAPYNQHTHTHTHTHTLNYLSFSRELLANFGQPIGACTRARQQAASHIDNTPRAREMRGEGREGGRKERERARERERATEKDLATTFTILG